MPARVPMTEVRRASLLALPETEEAVIRFHTLGHDDLAAIAEARTPETRLSYALQLCCLRYPGRPCAAARRCPSPCSITSPSRSASSRRWSPASPGARRRVTISSPGSRRASGIAT